MCISNSARFLRPQREETPLQCKETEETAMRRTLTALILTVSLALSLAVPIRAADPAEETDLAFSDVGEYSWYRDAVYWGVERGITNGAGDGLFLPQQTCARQQVAAFLHRYAGEPKPETDQVFEDVPEDHPFRDDILWCAGAGIANGAGDGLFDPYGQCTRAHIVTFLYRFAQIQGADVTAGKAGDLSPFSDASQIPAYAAEPFRWAVDAGLVNGTGSGQLAPNEPCTRAQILTMLYRWNWREEGFITKTVPVFRESLTETETAQLRYYPDLPNVPYMGLLDFYSRFLMGSMDLIWQEDDVCTLHQTDGTTATVDTAADTLDASNLTLFTYPPDYKEGPVTSGATVAPFLQVASVTADRDASPAHLDFASYGIDLRKGADDVYFPLATLSDLFAGYENYYVAFNGRNLYVVDDGMLFYQTSAMASDEHYYDPILDRGERPEDLADFAWRELCFNIDTFYGLPGSAPLNDALADQGLAGALEAAEPSLIPLVQSTDLAGHAAGLQRLLGYHLDDKGHTFFTGILSLLQLQGRDDFVRDLLINMIQSNGFETNPVSQARQDSVEAITSARTNAFGEKTYLSEGDTAIFIFDSFNVDYPGWTAYYDGNGPLPQDSVGNLKRALEQAQADPAVTNFVLDLTCNGGGDTNALFAMESLLLGSAEETMEDRLTGQLVTETYQVDRNFDGVFDQRDDQVSYDLHFAVLTSISSFSCGNILPSDCRDAGIMILGEQSSGGACPVQENVTADGLPYQLSTFLRIRNAAGEVIDGGVPVDADLLVTRTVAHEDKPGLETVEKDYSGFYDLTALSRLINAFYEEAAQPAA